MPTSVNALFSEDFPVKYIRVAFVFEHGLIMSMTLPFGVGTTAGDVVCDACLLSKRKFNRPLSAEGHDIAFLIEEPDGDAPRFAVIPKHAVLSMVPRVADLLRRGANLDVTLVPRHPPESNTDAHSPGNEHQSNPWPHRKPNRGGDISVISRGSIPRYRHDPVDERSQEAPSQSPTIDDFSASLERRIATLEENLAMSQATIHVLTSRLSEAGSRSPLRFEDDSPRAVWSEATRASGNRSDALDDACISTSSNQVTRRARELTAAVNLDPQPQVMLGEYFLSALKADSSPRRQNEPSTPDALADTNSFDAPMLQLRGTTDGRMHAVLVHPLLEVATQAPAGYLASMI